MRRRRRQQQTLERLQQKQKKIFSVPVRPEMSAEQKVVTDATPHNIQTGCHFQVVDRCCDGLSDKKVRRMTSSPHPFEAWPMRCQTDTRAKIILDRKSANSPAAICWLQQTSLSFSCFRRCRCTNYSSRKGPLEPNHAHHFSNIGLELRRWTRRRHGSAAVVLLESIHNSTATRWSNYSRFGDHANN